MNDEDEYFKPLTGEPAPMTEEEQADMLENLMEGVKEDPKLVDLVIKFARRIAEMVGGKVTSTKDDDIDWDKENEDEL